MKLEFAGSTLFVAESTCNLFSVTFLPEEAKQLRQFLNDNYRKLRPNKNWSKCPYEGHHDTCDCEGVGGDR